MRRTILLVTCAALAALPAAGAAAAHHSSAQPTVSVRIEGKKKTLLPATKVRAPTKAVKKGGHGCAADSGAGALNAATRGRWSGKWYSSLGFQVEKILGETDNYNTTHSFWELFVGNVMAPVGMCSLKLHKGEKLLFAAVPAHGAVYPLALKPLGKPSAGKPFKVKVVAYDAKGKPHPIAGATVTASAISAEPTSHAKITAKTNAHGIATLTESNAGLAELDASKHRYIRAAAVPVDVK